MRTVAALASTLAFATGCVLPDRDTTPLPPGTDPVARAGRADVILGELAEETGKARRMGGYVLVGEGLFIGGLGVFLIAEREETGEPETAATVGGIALGVGILSALGGLYQLTSRTDEEDVHARFQERAKIDAEPAVVAAQRDLENLADKRRGQLGIVRTIGLLLLGGGIAGMIAGERTDQPAYTGMGGMGVLFGGVLALASLADTPAEKAWAKWRVELGATPSASGSTVPTLGLAGRF